jgi:O-antigen/teichoic acid export membrane protein
MMGTFSGHFSGNRPDPTDANPPEAGRLKTLLASLPARARQALSGRVAIAVGWTTLAVIITQMTRLVGSLIMTRLLAPEMFGIMSIVLSVQITVSLLFDVGLRPAIMQSARGDDADMLNTAWTVQIIRGGVITILIALFAMSLPYAVTIGLFPIEAAWASPELPLVLAVASLSALINGFESTNAITAERNLALKRFTAMKLAGQLVGFFAMVLLGLLTRSIWAMVASGLLAATVVSVSSHIMLPGVRNRLAWSKDARAELAKYGSWVLLSSAASVLSMQADRLVLGGLIDSTALGLYSIALNLTMLVETLAGTCIWSVFLPALSKAARGESAQFRETYFRLRLPLDLGVIFVAGGLFASGYQIIHILYDDRYLPAGEMLSMLSFALLFTRYNITNAAYMALGKPHLTAIANSVRCVSLFAFLFGLYRYFGFDGAVAAVAFHMIPTVLAMFWFNRGKGLNNVRYELAVLLAWPIGYGVGLAFNGLIGAG